MSNLVQELYEPHVAAARARLETDARLRQLLSPSVVPSRLLRFFIQFCSLGVNMTEPVEGWIRRAGERCRALGLPEIGDALVAHAHHEAGHHLMMIDDTRLLVTRWNLRYPKLDAERLLHQEPTAAMRGYIRLHEDTIAGPAPECQVAIEYEIENLSTVMGPALMARCEHVLGPAVLAGLSFLTEHVAVDVGHTALNTRILERLLTRRPEAGARLGATGAAALDLYIDFLGDCWSTSAPSADEHVTVG